MSAPSAHHFKTQICIVDSNDKHREIACASLSPYYLVEDFSNSEEALEWLRANQPALVIVDEECIPLSGKTLLEAFYRIPFNMRGADMARPPLICTSAKKGSPFLVRAHELKADFLLLKPFKASQLIHAISALVNRKVEEKWKRLPAVLSNALLQAADLFDGLSDMAANDTPLPLSRIAQTCKALGDVCEQGKTEHLLKSLIGHNNLILVHSVRVAAYLAMFGRQTGVPKATLMSMIMAGLLHDIGKIEIPFHILNKPGSMSFDELSMMRSHVKYSQAMLAKTPGVPTLVSQMVAHHHERVDGTGYPMGLVGDAIGSHGKLLAVVDSFCAMTDIRPYRAPLTRDEAFQEMFRSAGGFDKGLLDAFAKLVTGDDSLSVPSEPHFHQQAAALAAATP